MTFIHLVTSYILDLAGIRIHVNYVKDHRDCGTVISLAKVANANFSKSIQVCYRYRSLVSVIVDSMLVRPALLALSRLLNLTMNLWLSEL